MSFDTTFPGAGERSWDNWARFLPSWIPPHVPLLVLAPHPDDETLGAGGLIHNRLHSGVGVTILLVSDGEAACPEVAGLGEIRQTELSDAMRILGAPPPEIIRMKIPDGQLATCEEAIYQQLCRLVERGALLAAPLEFDGHPDHDAAGKAAKRAARDRSAQLIRYPIWAWHLNSPLLRKAPTAARFCMSDEGWSAKQRAINCFRSQLTDRAAGAIVPPHVLEYFKRRYEVFLL